MRTRQALHGFLSRHMMAHVRSLRGMGLYHSLLHTTTTGHQPTFVNASAARLSRWEHRLLATKRPCPMRRTHSIYTLHDHYTWHPDLLHINSHSYRFLKHLSPYATHGPGMRRKGNTGCARPADEVPRTNTPTPLLCGRSSFQESNN